MASAWMAAVILCMAAPASATISWHGDADTNWYNPDNWDSYFVPMPYDWVDVHEGTVVADRTLTFDYGGRLEMGDGFGGIDVAFDGLVAGYRSFASLTLDPQNSSITAGTITLGELAGSEGYATMRGHFDPRFPWMPSYLVEVEHLVTVGGSGVGVLTLESGGLETKSAVVGQLFQSQGTVEGYGLLCSEDLVVGVYGEGSLTPEVPYEEADPNGFLRSKTGILGFGEGAVGTVALPASCSWDVENLLVVGYSGQGNIEIDGGTLQTGSAIVGGKWELMAGGTGAVNLDRGQWTNTGDLYVGEGGTGTVTADHSALSAGDAYFGYETGASGSLSLTDSSTMECANLFVGAYGTGNVTVGDGSTLSVSGRTYLGWQPGGEGTCTMDGGTLEARELHIGGDAVEGRLTKTDSFGLHRRDGLLEFTAGSQVNVTGKIIIGQCGSVTAAPGSTIRMEGASLENESTDPAALGGLLNIEMVFVNVGDEVATIEVAAEDLFPCTAGADGGFPIGKLTLSAGSSVRLVNETDNHPDASGPEALYVEHLVLGSGSTLDRNGLNLYYGDLTDNGGAIIGEVGGIEMSIQTALQMNLPGDIDGDGDVDLVDFAILKRNFGFADATWSDGDLNGDGMVDLTDFIILRENFGRDADTE